MAGVVRQLIVAGSVMASIALCGRSARSALDKGEAVAPGHLAPKGTWPSLAVKRTAGKRAFPLYLNDVSGLVGVLEPNSRVDIFVVPRGKRRAERSRLREAHTPR